jgi:hypothetical protein
LLYIDIVSPFSNNKNVFGFLKIMHPSSEVKNRFYVCRPVVRYVLMCRETLRPVFIITSRGKMWAPGVKLSPKGEVNTQG